MGPSFVCITLFLICLLFTSSKMYAVVVFTETSEVEVVPITWIAESPDNSYYYWPNVKHNELRKAVLEKKNPDLNNAKWQKYTIRILRKYGK